VSRAEKTAPAEPEGAVTLGSRLREERDRLGLSLRELARRLEVSPSLVSQIETGKTQPSVRTLYAIVSELGVSLDEVFVSAEESERDASATARAVDVVRAEPAPPREREGRVQRAQSRSVIDLGSGVRWERLTTWNDRDVDFLFAVYDVGGESSPAASLVRHNGREFGIVISGTLGVTVGFEEYVLAAGDSISFDSSVPHRLHNDGSEVVNAIWVVIGRHHPPA
jgi:transcriptional regulator with XRE-family HTH domain